LRWIALAVLFAGLAGVLIAAAVHIEARGAFPNGLLYPIRRYDQALSLLALGLVLAHLPGCGPLFGGALFAAGVPLGGFASNLIVDALLSGADIFDFLLAIPPVCCVMTGLALAFPRVRIWIGPPAAAACGMALGLVLNFDDPTAAEWVFAGGTVLSGLWLVLWPLLLWRAFAQALLVIPVRIFGSWVVAIGIMLGALHLIPHREGASPPVDPPAAGASSGREGAVVTAPPPR
jgi:hypothetical protein